MSPTRCGRLLISLADAARVGISVVARRVAHPASAPTGPCPRVVRSPLQVMPAGQDRSVARNCLGNCGGRCWDGVPVVAGVFDPTHSHRHGRALNVHQSRSLTTDGDVVEGNGLDDTASADSGLVKTVESGAGQRY